MTKLLIVEDEGLIAFDLARVVETMTGAEIVVASTLKDAWKHVEAGVDYCLLDIDIIGGKTYDLARALMDKSVPFAFTSASRRSNLPRDLTSATFISKPYPDGAIARALPKQMRASPAQGHCAS